jgi:hypothetical protein
VVTNKYGQLSYEPVGWPGIQDGLSFIFYIPPSVHCISVACVGGGYCMQQGLLCMCIDAMGCLLV